MAINALAPRNALHHRAILGFNLPTSNRIIAYLLREVPYVPPADLAALTYQGNNERASSPDTDETESYQDLNESTFSQNTNEAGPSGANLPRVCIIWCLLLLKKKPPSSHYIYLLS